MPTPEPGGLRARIALLVMLSGGLSIALIFTAIGPILSALSAHFGGGSRGHLIAQLTMTLPSIGVIVGGPLVGLLVERYGARRLLLAALLLFGASGSAGWYLDTALPLLASRLLLGFAGVAFATASTVLIGQHLSGNRRVRALGYWSAVGSAGSVVCILLAGLIGESQGWQGPFALYAVAFALFVLALYAFPAARTTPAPMLQARGSRGSLRAVWPVYATMVPVAVVVFMTGIQLSFLLAANGIDSPRLQSWIIGTASLGSMSGAVAYGFIQQRIGHGRCFALSLSLMAAGNLVLGTQTQPELAALGCLLNGLGGGMTLPYFGSLIIERIGEALRGRALGLMYTMVFAGEFANPLVVTPLHAQFGIRGAFVAIGALTALAAVYALVRRGHRAATVPLT